MKRKIVDESQITVNDLHFWSDSQAVFILKTKIKSFQLILCMHHVSEIKSSSKIADRYYVHRGVKTRF